MKKIRGGRLMVIGLIAYTPYYIASMILEEVPRWFWLISLAAFLGCFMVGFVQLMLLKKDDEVDEGLKDSIREHQDEIARSDYEMKEKIEIEYEIKNKEKSL